MFSDVLVVPFEGALLEAAAQVDGFGLVDDVGGESRQGGEPAIITGERSNSFKFGLHSIYVVKQIFAPNASSKLFMAKSA